MPNCRVRSPLEVGFGCVHLSGRGARREDLQDAELEVLPVPGVGGGQLAEGDVAAVPNHCQRGHVVPAAQNHEQV
jgi:hypothetical protein